MHLNVEIKARSSNNAGLRKILLDIGADFKGTDAQTDTYFQVVHGRLKLREGNIENNLIHYIREERTGPKQSEVSLYKSDTTGNLKTILCNALNVLIVVKKMREIYFIENVKFHLDEVENLGSFVEIEAIESGMNCTKEKLLGQCNYYMKLFGIDEIDLLKNSYSDMLAKDGL